MANPVDAGFERILYGINTLWASITPLRVSLAAILVLSGILVVAAFAGCSSTAQAYSPGTSPNPAPTPRVVKGDWNDLDAAVDVALTNCELAVLQWPDKSDDPRTYTLTSIHDEPGTLLARKLAGPPSGEGSTIELSVTIGHFGNAAAERCLLDGIERRLGQLLGRDFAPLD